MYLENEDLGGGGGGGGWRKSKKVIRADNFS